MGEQRTAFVLAGLGLVRDADAYICGPAAFMTEMSAALAGLGIAILPWPLVAA